MILVVKHRCSFYRKFELDIWGLCYVDSDASPENYRKSWYLRFFLKMYKAKILRRWKRMRRYIYRIDIIDIRKRRRKYKTRWLTLRLTRLYFLTLHDDQFRQLFLKARKLTGDLESNYCHLLECRLFPLLYRTNLLPDMFLSLRFVQRGKVFVNFRRMNYVNAHVSVGSFMVPKRFWRLWIRYQFKKRLRLKAVLFNTARFLFISFKFLYVYLLRKPVKRDLVYPISIDIQRITGYY